MPQSLNTSAPVIAISGALPPTESVEAMAEQVRRCGALPRVINTHVAHLRHDRSGQRECIDRDGQ